MNTVALVTYREMPHLSADDRLLLEPLAALGVRAVPTVWDDPEVQWHTFDAVVVRSIWDYHKRILEFDEWLARMVQIGVRVWNPAAMLRWNSDKRYLLDLRQRGVPMVPTAILTRDRVVDLGYVLQSNGWGRAVVKPTVSASSYRTWLTEPATAQRDQKELLAMMMHSDVIVQPFMSEIVKDGEYSFVFFDGQYSHCVHKQPRHGDYRTQPEHGGRWRPYAASKMSVAQARAMLSTLPSSPMYARVDCIASGDRLLLMEMELIEPDLGMTYDVSAAPRFANAIVRAMRPTLPDGETLSIDAPV